MGVEEHEKSGPFLCGVETPLEIQYDWQSDDSLSATIVQNMIEAADVDPKDVPCSFYNSVNPDALEDVFRPQFDGTPRANVNVSFTFAGHYITVQDEGHVSIESELGQLKRMGGNILLTGDVPEDVLDQLSVSLLGDSAFDRTVLFAQYGRGAEDAQTRLSLAGTTPDHAHILTNEAAARSAANAQSSQFGGVSVSSVTGSLDEFQNAIREQVLDLQRQQNGFDSAEFRFCFDSLRLLLDEQDTEASERFIETIANTIEAVDGLGHYILPDTYDSRSVQAVQSKFDIVLELRTGVNGLEQRLHLHDTDHRTQWYPI